MFGLYDCIGTPKIVQEYMRSKGAKGSKSEDCTYNHLPSWCKTSLQCVFSSVDCTTICAGKAGGGGVARPSLSRGNEQYADDADLVRFLNPTHSEESVG